MPIALPTARTRRAYSCFHLLSPSRGKGAVAAFVVSVHQTFGRPLSREARYGLTGIGMSLAGLVKFGMAGTEKRCSD
jgi:hypothetical protein